MNDIISGTGALAQPDTEQRELLAAKAQELWQQLDRTMAALGYGAVAGFVFREVPDAADAQSQAGEPVLRAACFEPDFTIEGVRYLTHSILGSGVVRLFYEDRTEIVRTFPWHANPWWTPCEGFERFMQSGHAAEMHRRLLVYDLWRRFISDYRPALTLQRDRLQDARLRTPTIRPTAAGVPRPKGQPV